MLTVWRRAWPASVLPVLALTAALAWPTAAPPEPPPTTQEPAEVSGPRPAVQPRVDVRRTLPAAPRPGSAPTARAVPSPVPGTTPPSPVAEVAPAPAPSTTSPGLEKCVEDLLGEVRLDC